MVILHRYVSLPEGNDFHLFGEFIMNSCGVSTLISWRFRGYEEQTLVKSAQLLSEEDGPMVFPRLPSWHGGWSHCYVGIPTAASFIQCGHLLETSRTSQLDSSIPSGNDSCYRKSPFSMGKLQYLYGHFP